MTAMAFVALAFFAATMVAAQTMDGASARDKWSAQELATIASMRLKEAGVRPADPSNAYEQRTDAAALGRALFDDTRLSRNGQVACASCHLADKQFQDGKPVGEGIGTGTRRTMPVMGASHSPFLFWDGRKDSAWSQALGPFEDGAEHGANRVRLTKLVQVHYKDKYQAVFGPMPELGKLPDDASPAGAAAERAAWAAMPAQSRDAVNRVFANMGKSIAAFEQGIAYGESRFDRYAQASVSGDARGQQVLSPQEVRGLRLYVTKGQCVTCHNGPLLTDHAFHNTGVPPIDRNQPDRGRAEGVRKLLQDELPGPVQRRQARSVRRTGVPCGERPGPAGGISHTEPAKRGGERALYARRSVHEPRAGVAALCEVAQVNPRAQRAGAARGTACGSPADPALAGRYQGRGGIPANAHRAGGSGQVTLLLRTHAQGAAHLQHGGGKAEHGSRRSRQVRGVGEPGCVSCG